MEMVRIHVAETKHDTVHPSRAMGAYPSTEADAQHNEETLRRGGQDPLREEWRNMLVPSRDGKEGMVCVETWWKEVESRTDAKDVDMRNQVREIAWETMKDMFHVQNIQDKIEWDAFQNAAIKTRGDVGSAIRRILDHCTKHGDVNAAKQQVTQTMQVAWYMIGMPVERAEKLATRMTEGCFEELEKKEHLRVDILNKPRVLQWIMEKIPGLCTTADDSFLAILGFGSKPEDRNLEVQEEMQVVLLSTHYSIPPALVPDCLYDSHQDGSSLSRLLSKTAGYPGPLFLKVTYGQLNRMEGHEWCTIGVLIDAELKNSREVYGGDKCTLYSFSPSFHVYRTKPLAHCRVYSYSRPPLKSSGHLKGWEGLGFGGKCPGQHRLALDKDLDKVTFRHWREDDSYEAGPLFPAQEYSTVEGLVSHVQAFGMGGSQSLQAMNTEQRRHAAFIEDRRKIDMKKFAEEWRGGGGDKALLGMMSHPNVARGESVRDLRRAGPTE